MFIFECACGRWNLVLYAALDAKLEARIERYRVSLVALVVERIILLAAGAGADGELAVGN